MLGIALSKPLSFPVGKVEFLTIAQKLENYLKAYYITGGMPEAVATWIETKDIEKLEAVQQKIIDSYEMDFAKHAPNKVIDL